MRRMEGWINRGQLRELKTSWGREGQLEKRCWGRMKRGQRTEPEFVNLL
jgi:hypothetical protein